MLNVFANAEAATSRTPSVDKGLTGQKCIPPNLNALPDGLTGKITPVLPLALNRPRRRSRLPCRSQTKAGARPRSRKGERGQTVERERRKGSNREEKGVKP